VFAELIESGRRLVAKNERYRHTHISDIPIEERMASSETSGWFMAAKTLIADAFGRDSRELARWHALQKKISALDYDEIRTDRWNEGESNVRRLHASMGLLTELDVYAASRQRRGPWVPPELVASLESFRASHPDPRKAAFVMMRFGQTEAHKRITTAIRVALEPIGIAALRADERQFHDDLFSNVLTYVHGCGFGIAVFERIEKKEFNPNVALEVGYMLALNKRVCFLKDRTLTTLHADLVGKLYRSFDSLHPEHTIPGELSQWTKDVLP
jgi:hypothetical protein